MNEGKKFEEDFKKSVPSSCFYYRFKDGTSSWDKGSNTRFQSKNICDCMVYNPNYPDCSLYLFELKSHKGKSIPINCIRANQIEGLLEASKKRVNCYVIFNMRDINKTYAVIIEDLNNFIETTTRKSIPISFIESVGKFIPQEKKKARWKYNLENFLR